MVPKSSRILTNAAARFNPECDMATLMRSRGNRDTVLLKVDYTSNMGFVVGKCPQIYCNVQGAVVFLYKVQYIQL
jgi:hypothetical protein